MHESLPLASSTARSLLATSACFDLRSSSIRFFSPNAHFTYVPLIFAPYHQLFPCDRLTVLRVLVSASILALYSLPISAHEFGQAPDCHSSLPSQHSGSVISFESNLSLNEVLGRTTDPIIYPTRPDCTRYMPLILTVEGNTTILTSARSRFIRSIRAVAVVVVYCRVRDRHGAI
jgi:hypothetical protein